MNEISSKLSQYFRDRHITQETIADTLGVSQQYVSGLLSGKKAFGKKQAQRFYECWGISPSWLLTGEGEMSKSEAQQSSKGDNTIQVSGTNVDMRNINQSKNTGDEKRVKELEQRIEELTKDKERLQNLVDKMQAQISTLLEKI